MELLKHVVIHAGIVVIGAADHEQSDAVLWAHVELYVNQWTLDLGRGGREALAGLLRLSRERGLPELDQELEILQL